MRKYTGWCPQVRNLVFVSEGKLPIFYYNLSLLRQRIYDKGCRTHRMWEYQASRPSQSREPRASRPHVCSDVHGGPGVDFLVMYADMNICRYEYADMNICIDPHKLED
jgi:hypothetical protein